MRHRKFFIIFIILLVMETLFAGSVASAATSSKSARTRYVTDELAITMRSGKSNQHRIIRSLPSGSRLRVLKSDKDYTRVKTKDGEIGWVLNRYLVESPVARTVLPPIQKRLAAVEAQNKELNQQLKETTKERNKLKKIATKYDVLVAEHDELTKEAVKLRQMVAESSGLFNANEKLTHKTKSLNAQVDVLMSEIKELGAGNDKLWFITGAGVILVGFLAGVMVSRRSRKNTQSSWASASDTLMLRQPSING
jgi:SH3 domain protein